MEPGRGVPCVRRRRWRGFSVSPPGWVSLRTLACLSGAALVLGLSGCERSTSPSADAVAGVVLREALTTRALAIEAPATAQTMIDAMPVGPMGRDAAETERRLLAWSAFFRGTLVKLGRVASTEPVTLFYNPLLDVGIVQACPVSAKDGAVTCRLLCAIPGEALTGDELSPRPSWLEKSDPFAAITRNAGARTAGFSKLYPPDATATDVPVDRLCSDAHQAIAEVRVLEGLLSLAAVDPAALGQAIGEFLSRSNATATTNSATDTELRDLLGNLSALTLSGAVALKDRGWVLFFTPKATGWRQVAVVVGPAGKRGLKLEAARVLVIQSEAPS